jgi:serine/threonine protein kinase
MPRQDKRFSCEDLSSFKREAEKLATLGRVPGIVTVFDHGERNGQPYIVSDFIEGESLQDRLKRGAPTYEESAELIAEVATALNRAHLKNLVHRDIKPANILLDNEGRPFLADFGLCVSEEEQLREGHATVGTFAYMSPEQARGESHRTDGRADIYALGVVLYRMLTGRLPFVGTHPSEYLDQIVHRNPRPPRSIDPRIPVELERICLKCLNKAVTERYATAGDLARELRGWKAPARSRHGIVYAAAAAIIVLGLVVWRLWEPAPQQEPSAATDQAVPGSIQNLLRKQPREVIFDRRRPFNNWNWDPQTQSLHLRSQDEAMISCGEWKASDHTLNAVIDSQPIPSLFGFFWGLHEEDTLDEERIYRAKAVMVYSGNQGEDDEIQLLSLTLVPDGDTGMRVRNFLEKGTIESEFPPQSKWRITIGFGRQGAMRLIVNGQECRFEAPQADAASYAAGEVGLLSYTGDFVVRRLFWDTETNP